MGGGESDPAEGKGEERPREVRSHGTSHADSACGPHADDARMMDAFHQVLVGGLSSQF